MKHDGPVYASVEVACGRLKMRHAGAFATQLRELRDGEYEIRLERLKATRSQQQNAWYWSCVVRLVSDHTGYSPDEIHEIFKAKFLPKLLTVADGNGEIAGEFVIGGSTTRLSTKEFSEYCEAIRLWAAEALGVLIPDPGERAA